MRARVLVAAIAVVFTSAWSSSAQVVSLEFRDGRVRLIAERAQVSAILAEWTRLGKTRIVNGERIPGAPVTLQLLDVPERDALGVVLRGAAGYIVSARDSSAPGASIFDRILILPTTARTPSAPAVSQPAPRARAPIRQVPSLAEPPEGNDSQDELGQPGAAGTQDGPAGEPPPPDTDTPDNAGPAAEPVPVAPGNPFGVLPGSTQPGVIAPIPRPPRGPDTAR